MRGLLRFSDYPAWQETLLKLGHILSFPIDEELSRIQLESCQVEICHLEEIYEGIQAPNN